MKKDYIRYIVIVIIIFAVIFITGILLDNKYISTFSSLLYCAIAFYIGYLFAKDTFEPKQDYEKIIKDKEDTIKTLIDDNNKLYRELHDSEAYKNYEAKLAKTREEYEAELSDMYNKNESLKAELLDREPKFDYDFAYNIHTALLVIQKTLIRLNVSHDLEICLQVQKDLLPFMPNEESDYLTQQIERILEYID